jgi:hypothetical protein
MRFSRCMRPYLRSSEVGVRTVDGSSHRLRGASGKTAWIRGKPGEEYEQRKYRHAADE